MSDPFLHVLLVVVGIAIGVAGGYFGFPAIREAKRLREQLEHLLQEHESYKAAVNAHFRKTADLVGQMTKSYAAIYDHLAGGARRFCDDAEAETRLPFGPLPEALGSPEIEAAEVAEGASAEQAAEAAEPAESEPEQQRVAS